MQYPSDRPFDKIVIYWFVIPNQELEGNGNNFRVAIWVHMCAYVLNCKRSHFIQFNWTNYGKHWTEMFVLHFFLVSWCNMQLILYCNSFFLIHFMLWSLYKSHDYKLKWECRKSGMYCLYFYFQYLLEVENMRLSV